MPGLNEIGLGNQPNDGLGDGARTGGSKINAMFKELFYRRFFVDVAGIVYSVTRTAFDPNDGAPTELKADDKLEGYTNSQKTRWVAGVIIDPNLSIPGDFNDTSKFLKLVDKLRIS